MCYKKARGTDPYTYGRREGSEASGGAGPAHLFILQGQADWHPPPQLLAQHNQGMLWGDCAQHQSLPSPGVPYFFPIFIFCLCLSLFSESKQLDPRKISGTAVFMDPAQPEMGWLWGGSGLWAGYNEVMCAGQPEVQFLTGVP